jgi:excisionase family DNA binding protein
MSVAPLSRQTYLPDPGEQVARVHDFLAAHERAGRGRVAPRYLLAGAAPGEQVELPPEVYRVLVQVIEAMRANLAVTVVPQTQTLTTQQAADLLGVSRPTVVKLLDEGKVPYERVGTHRRILLRDLLDYRDVRREEQYTALEAMSTDLDDEEDLDTVLAGLRRARAAVAEQRRTRSGPSQGQ